MNKRARVKPIGYLKLTDTSKTHIPELIRQKTSVDPGGKIPFLISSRVILLYDPKILAEDLIKSINSLEEKIR